MKELLKEKYKRLPLALKLKIVEEKGNYITRRKHLKYNIELFELKDFYVEVGRSIFTNQVYWIECPGNNFIYSKYLDKIKIEELF